MTSTPQERDTSVRSFLFGQTGAAGPALSLGEAMTGHDVARSVLRGFRRLSTSVLEAVDQEIGDTAEGMLEIGLGDALVHGWLKHAELMASARRTLSAPGSEVVPLASHQVTSTYRPNVDLLVDGGVVGSVEFEARLVFEVTGLAAVVRAGSLAALRGGDILLTATVLLYGETIASRQDRLDPQWVVRLDPPLVLAEPEPAG